MRLPGLATVYAKLAAFAEILRHLTKMVNFVFPDFLSSEKVRARVTARQQTDSVNGFLNRAA